MKRRTFLQFLAAAPAAAVLPAPAPTADSITAGIVRNIEALNKLRNDYFAFIHPSMWFDIRRLRARELWYGAYREWRRGGRGPETLRQVMARVKKSAEEPVVQTMREGLMDALKYGSIGRYEGVRIIESAWIPPSS